MSQILLRIQDLVSRGEIRISEHQIEDSVFSRVGDLLSGADRSTELEIIRFGAQ